MSSSGIKTPRTLAPPFVAAFDVGVLRNLRHARDIPRTDRAIAAFANLSRLDFIEVSPGGKDWRITPAGDAYLTWRDGADADELEALREHVRLEEERGDIVPGGAQGNLAISMRARARERARRSE